MKLIDLTGQKFGRLTVIKRFNNKNNRHTQWICKCECGNECIVNADNLKKGHTQSCGCLSREQAVITNTIHGLSKTKIHKVWDTMIQRTTNPNNSSYKKYGGRGIRVCEEWRNNFKTFYDWAISNGYKEGLSIDRIDVNGNYEPSNCRWANQKEQARNRRNNRLITYNNETHCIAEWAEITKLSISRIAGRLQRGWEIERIFTTP